MVYLYDACDQISDFCHQQLLRKMRRHISWTDGRREGRTEGRTDGRRDGQTDRGKTVQSPPPSGSGGMLRYVLYCLFYHTSIYNGISLSDVLGFLFYSYQSPMSFPFKTGYTPRYVDRLVNILNCFAQDWTVKDKRQVPDIIYCPLVVVYSVFRPFWILKR